MRLRITLGRRCLLWLTINSTAQLLVVVQLLVVSNDANVMFNKTVVHEILFSIELEKQKAEHDRMVKIAEEKKQVTRIRMSF